MAQKKPITHSMNVEARMSRVTVATDIEEGAVTPDILTPYCSRNRLLPIFRFYDPVLAGSQPAQGAGLIGVTVTNIEVLAIEVKKI